MITLAILGMLAVLALASGPARACTADDDPAELRPCGMPWSTYYQGAGARCPGAVSYARAGRGPGPGPRRRTRRHRQWLARGADCHHILFKGDFRVP